jgi:hypothetical protein
MTTQTTLKRKPVQAAIWGFLLGLGVVIYLIFVFPVIGLDKAGTVFIKAGLIIGGVMVLSVLWGLFAPAKKPRGPAPAGYGEAPPAAPIDETPPAAPLDEMPPAAPLDEVPPAAVSTDDDEEPAS